MPREDLVDIRGGTVTEWTAANPVLAANEIAVVWEDDMSRSTVIVGDGTTQAMDLYATASDTYLTPADAADTYAPITGLRISSTNGEYVSTPDHADLDVTDLDVAIKLTLDDWSPSSAMGVCGKWLSSTNERGWALEIAFGIPKFYWSTAGTVTLARDAGVAVGATDGTPKWVRVTLDVDNGASGHDIKFYKSDDGVTWTQIGSTYTGSGTTSIHAHSQPLVAGAGQSDGTGNRGNMVVHKMIQRASIDGAVVASLDCTVPTSPRYRDPTGKVWTFNGSEWSWVKT